MLVEKGKNVLYYYLTMLKDIHLRQHHRAYE